MEGKMADFQIKLGTSHLFWRWVLANEKILQSSPPKNTTNVKEETKTPLDFGSPKHIQMQILSPKNHGHEGYGFPNVVSVQDNIGSITSSVKKISPCKVDPPKTSYK